MTHHKQLVLISLHVYRQPKTHTCEAGWCCCAAGLNGAAALFNVEVLPRLRVAGAGAEGCSDRFNPEGGWDPNP